jgi:SNF2 family DNA or RNA helicase
MERIKMDIHAGIDGERLSVKFPFDQEVVSRVKKLPGARFVPREKGGPYWTLPLKMESARALREAFGASLKVSKELKTWAWEQVKRHDALGSLASADDAELEYLPQNLEELSALLRPYQRAAVKFIATSGNPLIADQQGLGKTLEVIGGLFEFEEVGVASLIIAPKVALRNVWEKELKRFQPYPVFVMDGDRTNSEKALLRFMAVVEAGEPAWLITNPAKVRFRAEWNTNGCELHDGSETAADRKKCGHCFTEDVLTYPQLLEVPWDVTVIDEVHRDAVKNPKSKGAKAIRMLKGKRRIAISGTPMDRPIHLWGILNYLNPKEFSSKWNWANQWLHTYNNGFGWVFCTGTRDNGQLCEVCEGGILRHRLDEFFEHLKPYVLRRTKAEVAKELPPKQIVPVWCEMTPAQEAQYDEFAKEAELIINDERVSASIKLTELLRLKQFAIAKQKIVDDNLIPTEEGGKIEALLELLEEHDESQKLVVFSQFREVVDMLERLLERHGIKTFKITGKVTQKVRDQAVAAFQSDGGPRVMLMTTTAGGVAITLDRADSVIFMDETWSPTDMEQAEDRVHRISRIHNVTVYYLRTSGTVDEYIMGVVTEKADIASLVMDIRRGVAKLR